MQYGVYFGEWVVFKICLHSTGRYWALLALGTVRCALQGACTFWMLETVECLLSNEKHQAVISLELFVFEYLLTENFNKIYNRKVLGSNPDSSTRISFFRVIVHHSQDLFYFIFLGGKKNQKLSVTSLSRQLTS